MAKIPDSTKLVHMNLPGTHDTSTCKPIQAVPLFLLIQYCLRIEGTIRTQLKHHSFGTLARKYRPITIDRWTNNTNETSHSIRSAEVYRCQEKSILQSLNDGIRVFDLRVAYNPGNDTIGLHHCKSCFLSPIICSIAYRPFNDSSSAPQPYYEIRRSFLRLIQLA